MIRRVLDITPSEYLPILSGRRRFVIVPTAGAPAAMGESLLLREWDPAKREFTGRAAEVIVTYVSDSEPGLMAGFTIVGVAFPEVRGGTMERPKVEGKPVSVDVKKEFVTRVSASAQD